MAINNEQRRKAYAIVALAYMTPLLALEGCTIRRMEEEFFLGTTDLAVQIDQLRQYSLEDQYRIFRYGVRQHSPPLTELAVPIAERGPAAVASLLYELNPPEDEYVIRDVVLIFETMHRIGSYDPWEDAAVMSALRARVSAIQDVRLRAECETLIIRMAAGRSDIPARSTQDSYSDS